MSGPSDAVDGYECMVTSPKPSQLPLDVAREFVEDMNAYFDEEDKHQRDAIAVRQLRALQAHQAPTRRCCGSAASGTYR